MSTPETSDLTSFRQRLRDLEDDLQPSALPPPKKHRAFNPHRLMAITFLVLILIGTFLLITPWAQTSGQWAWQFPGAGGFLKNGWRAVLDNFFMATSAACVTGLTVVDVPTVYTPFGHGVLAACIQLGGLSLMTLGTLIVTLLLGRVPVEGEERTMISYGGSLGSAQRLLWQTVRYVFAFEAVGAAIFFLCYHFRYGYTLGKSLWYALFHAISAFCNAGISLHPNNLELFRGDLTYTLTATLLVTLGGIGFLVIANVFHYHFWRRDLRKRGHISLHARIVLWTSLILCLGGGLLFTLLEWHASLRTPNAQPLIEALLSGHWLPIRHALADSGERLVTGISQAAMFRTAGFNLVPMDAISAPANLLSVLLMLIGGSPGSMAGGIKTTTLVVLLLTIRAYIRGAPAVEVHHRTLSNAICREAMVIVFFYLATVFLFYFVLLSTETRLIALRGDFALFYEVSSAVGTVGTSLNATPHLSPIGRLIIALAMFLGRIGPISIVLMMARRHTTHWTRCPEETITVG